MSGEHLKAQARRVLVGNDADGKSTIVEDELTSTRLPGPGNTKCDIWRLERVPAPLNDSDGLDGLVKTPPPLAGLVYRVTTFPPDSEWDRSQGYSDSAGSLPGSVAADVGGIPGLHETHSFDILTVISGEMYLIVENGETLLRQGDTLVMRGGKHAWSNRTDQPVSVVTVMIAADHQLEQPAQNS
jgi:mannose-6-phosphate isomerase-like protein (cupin superfamily)